jgi:hypothetical protein
MTSAEIQYNQSFVELFDTLIQIVKTERAQTKAERNNKYRDLRSALTLHT